MANREQVKGVMANPADMPPVKRKPYNPKRQFMSHADAVAENERMKRADEAAEKARREVLENNDVEENQAEETASKETNEAQLASLRSELAAVEKKLSKDPDSKTLKKQKTKIEDKIEELESVE